LIWQSLLASTAVVLGVSIWCGHASYSAFLIGRFGYHGSVFVVYSHEEILMKGASLLLNQFSLDSVLAALAAYGLHVIASRRRIRHLPAAFAGLYTSFVALVVVSGVANFWPDDSYAWLTRNSHTIFLAVFICLLYPTIAILTGRFLCRVETWARVGVLLAGWLFALVYFPFFISGGHDCPPVAKVTFKDSKDAVDFRFLNRRDGMLILGDPRHNRIRLILEDDVASVLLETCPDPR